MKTLNSDQLATDLSQFTGTTQWHRWSRLTNLICTDDVKYLAEEAGAYWLLDEIASHQKNIARKFPNMQSFQIWLLCVNENQSCRLTGAEDSDVEPAIRQEIAYTDFPLKQVKLYVCDNIVLLPSEY